ncbi:MAG: hypothetical protein ACOCP4_06190 [Candidatus Woesearchaeota archaeon]
MKFFILRRKKGFMFSFVTILFFILIITFSLYLVDHKKKFENLEKEDFIENIKYYYTTDIGYSICNITKFYYSGSSYKKENVTINFDKLWEANNFTSLENDYDNYKFFIENKYSNITNADFNLYGNVFGFSMPDYGIQGNFSSSNISLFFRNPYDVNSFDADIYINDNDVDINSSPSDDGALNPLVNINFYNSSNSLIESFSINLNLSENNDDFFVNFSSGSYVKVNFEDKNFVVNASGTIAEIKNVSINHKKYEDKTNIISGAYLSVFGTKKNIIIN